MERHKTRQVRAGKVAIGGGAPVTVQSMLSVPSTDIAGSVDQAVRLEKAGCQISFRTSFVSGLKYISRSLLIFFSSQDIVLLRYLA